MSKTLPKPIDFPAEFLRHYRSLWLVAIGVVANAADAEDVLQEAAIVGIRKQESFSPGTSFLAWMGEIVRNLALNRRRQVRREIQRHGQAVDAHQVDVADRPSGKHPIGMDGSMLSTQESIDDRMLHALMALDAVARSCILLRTIGGLEYSEISQILGIPEGTAMSHVFRCRRVLAALLSNSDDRRR